VEIRRQVGQNVKRFRHKKAWSQEELAFKANFHRTYVSGIERGVRNPTVVVIAKLAKVLGVTPGSLVDPPPRQN
jgi:transcriptional regulator with XRE-family HTH domain